MTGRRRAEDNVPTDIGYLRLTVHEDGYFGRKSVDGRVKCGWRSIHPPTTTRSEK